MRAALLPPVGGGWRSWSVGVVAVVVVLVGVWLVELAPGEAGVGARCHRESVCTEVGGKPLDDGAGREELAPHLLVGQMRKPS